MTQQIVAAIEANAEEVLADPTSELVKASLSNDLTTLYPTLQVQWDAGSGQSMTPDIDAALNTGAKVGGAGAGA